MIGGLLGFGLVGIFVGPVMLAVSYTLIDARLRDTEPPASMPRSSAKAAGAAPRATGSGSPARAALGNPVPERPPAEYV